MKTSKKQKTTFSLMLYIFMSLLVACHITKPDNTSNSYNLIETTTPSNTPESTKKPTITVTVTPDRQTMNTPIPLVKSNVLSGEYIYVNGWPESGEFQNFVVDEATMRTTHIISGNTLLVANDGTNIYYAENGTDFLLSLKDNNSMVPIPSECEYFSMSPDKTYITTGWCGDEISPEFGIGIYNLVTTEHISGMCQCFETTEQINYTLRNTLYCS